MKDKSLLACNIICCVIAPLICICLVYCIYHRPPCFWQPSPSNAEAFTKVHTYKQVPIEIVDTAGKSHTIMSDQFGFHHSQLVGSTDDHAIVYWVDPKTQVPSFIHIKPCNKCAELEFLEKKRMQKLGE